MNIRIDQRLVHSVHEPFEIFCKIFLHRPTDVGNDSNWRNADLGKFQISNSLIQLYSSSNILFFTSYFVLTDASWTFSSPWFKKGSKWGMYFSKSLPRTSMTVPTACKASSCTEPIPWVDLKLKIESYQIFSDDTKKIKSKFRISYLPQHFEQWRHTFIGKFRHMLRLNFADNTLKWSTQNTLHIMVLFWVYFSIKDDLFQINKKIDFDAIKNKTGLRSLIISHISFHSEKIIDSPHNFVGRAQNGIVAIFGRIFDHFHHSLISSRA